MNQRLSKPRRASAYSLLELVLALAVLAVLMLGAQSALLLASKALPDNRSPQARHTAAAQALDQLCWQLADAVTMNRADPDAIEFVVPDRGGDGQAETIRYYRGSTSEKLRRVYNGKSQNLLDSVESLSLTYQTQTLTDPATYVEGNEVLLASNDPGVNLAPYPVESSHWIATTFRPVLPSDAEHWTLTRVKLRARMAGFPLGHSLVQVRPGAAGVPGDVVLDEDAIYETALPLSFGWYDVQFPKSPRFAPGESASLVVRWGADDQSCDVEYQTAGQTSSRINLATTANAGGTWSADGTRAMVFYAYGRIASPTTPTQTRRLHAVRIALKLKGMAPMVATALVPNRPQMPEAD